MEFLCVSQRRLDVPRVAREEKGGAGELVQSQPQHRLRDLWRIIEEHMPGIRWR